MLGVARHDAADQVMRARDTVRLDHLGHRRHHRGSLAQSALGKLDEDERRHRVSERLSIDLGAMPRDHAA